MSSSSFLCNWDNIIHVSNKISSMINKISQSPIHCSKVNIKCVLNCTNFPGNKFNEYIFKTNWSSFEKWYKTLGACFNKKSGKNKFTFPKFWQIIIILVKTIEIGPGDFFPNQTWGLIWLKLPLFYVYRIDFLRHHYGFILRYHRTRH